MSRPMGYYERAAVYTDRQAPFQAAVSATLDISIDPQAVRRALSALVRRQPLVSMRPAGRRFEPCGVAEPEFIVRDGDAAVLAKEVNLLLVDRPGQRGAHPVRARVIRGRDSTSLVIAAPHYLVDAVSLATMLFASLGDEGKLDATAPVPTAVEERFPSKYRRLRSAPRIARFLASQIADEARIRLGRIGAKLPTVPSGGNSQHVLRNIDAHTLTRLGEACRRHQCTLNGLLTAAAARGFVTEFLRRKQSVVGVMSFRDLRPRVQPPVPRDQLGVNFSMVRHAVEVPSGSMWPLAVRISQKIAASGRRGDAFAANLLAPQMVSGALRMGMRFADVAVSLPVLRWPLARFASHITQFAGYVSAMPVAPPFSIIAAQSPAGLCLSFLYLDTVLDDPTALRLADMTVRLLHDALSEEGR